MKPAQEFERVADGLLFWQAYDPSVKCDLSSVAYRGLDGWVLIDPIPLAPAAWAEAFAEEKPKRIAVTNANHARAVTEYRQKYGCPVMASPLAAEELEVSVDEFLTTARHPSGLQSIFIPGATRGETAYLSPEGYLLLGDAVIHLDSTGLALLPAKYCHDARQNRDSLKTLLDYEFSIVTFAHGLPLRQQAKSRLAQLLADE
jgi:glyoxylase-like metal-dependent hydrolase (beta-lactamase superfamily II)